VPAMDAGRLAAVKGMARGFRMSSGRLATPSRCHNGRPSGLEHGETRRGILANPWRRRGESGRSGRGSCRSWR
jgi:hypothetical protein